MVNIVYVAATDKMSWGKGTSAAEAVINAVRHAYKTCGKIQIVEVSINQEVELLKNVYLNEMGGLVMPKGATATTLGTIQGTDHLSGRILNLCADINEAVEKLDGSDVEG